MPTPFTPVVNGQVIEPDNVNRTIIPINDLEEFREGTLPNLGDQDLGNHKLENLAAGTAAAPALSFQGDADTGVYSPEANSAAVATGGVQRARFDAAGVTISGLVMPSGATAGHVLTADAAGVATWQATQPGVTDHGDLTGLGDDDHGQYALLGGRASGQTLIGGATASENLALRSTANATKGKILLGTGSAYDEANDRLGVGTASPSEKLEVSGTAKMSGLQVTTGAGSGKVLTSDASGMATWQAAAPDLSGEPFVVTSPSAGLTNERVLTGTANQVAVTPGAGTVTLSAPQDLHTAAAPQFGRLGLGTAAHATNPITTAVGFEVGSTGVVSAAASTVAAPTLSVTQTGTHGSYAWDAIRANITGNYSPNSKLLDLQQEGASRVIVSARGAVTIATNPQNQTQIPLSLSSTWSHGSYTWYGLLMNITDSGSMSSSKLLDLQIGGSSRFSVDKQGFVTIAGPSIQDGNRIPLSVAATWNYAYATFYGAKLNITDTASHANSKYFLVQQSGADAFAVAKNSNVVIGSAALATNATDGFLYIPTCPGAPTGTPTSHAGRAPLVYDSTNNDFYVYNGGWKKVALS